MEKSKYIEIENHMLSCMNDSAHDKEHIYRVLYVALDIARFEKDVDYDVLIAACLLHDIGRKEQFENPALSHAIVGGEKAYRYLLEKGWEDKKASFVRECIEKHSFRANNPPIRTEAKILFDADKIDITGTLGIARTIFYKGQVSEPLYSLLPDGRVSDGRNDEAPSFFKEYRFKLERLYDGFHTNRAREIAKERRQSAVDFYESMLKEAQSSYDKGRPLLKNHIECG